MPGDKYFLDTNIFAYLLDERDVGKHLAAKDLVQALVTKRTAVCSYQVEQEFFNVAFRKKPIAMTADEARLSYAKLFSKIYSVPSSSMLLLRAVEIKERYRLAWYDSLIVAAALEADCAVLFSEDFQAGQIFERSLTVINPLAV